MGAYYDAANLDKKERLSSHLFGSGSKLMEHSYIGNEFISYIMEALAGGRKETETEVGIPDWKGNRLMWLCDYHEDPEINWETIKSIDIPEIKLPDYLRDESSGKKLYTPNKKFLEKSFIVNIDKKCYIDMKKLKKLLRGRGIKELFITPLSILTNSDETSMGGGDLHQSDFRRGSWRGDHVAVESKKPKGFGDVTEMSLFIEED